MSYEYVIPVSHASIGWSISTSLPSADAFEKCMDTNAKSNEANKKCAICCCCHVCKPITLSEMD